jgi:hypothetical protein
MSTTALCWVGSTSILIVSLILIAYGLPHTAIAVSLIGQVTWGFFTGAKGWHYFGKRDKP